MQVTLAIVQAHLRFYNLILDMLQPISRKEDMKRCRTTLMSGAEIRLAYGTQSCCSKNCMQKLIQGSHAPRENRSRDSNRRSNSSSGSISVISSVDEDSTFVDREDSSLFCQQIGMPTTSIPLLEFDKFIEEVRRPFFALTTGTTSIEEANDQLRYYLVQKFTENRIGGDPNDKHNNFLYLYQLHSLSRGVITVCKTTYIIITGVSLSVIEYAQKLVRKNTSPESIILRGTDDRSIKQESLKEAFVSFGMNYNLYQQNVNQFVDIMKIPESPTAFICVTFLAEWFELAGEQEVS